MSEAPSFSSVAAELSPDDFSFEAYHRIAETPEFGEFYEAFEKTLFKRGPERMDAIRKVVAAHPAVAHRLAGFPDKMYQLLREVIETDAEDDSPIGELPLGEDSQAISIKGSPYDDPKILKALHYLNAMYAVVAIGSDYRILYERNGIAAPEFRSYAAVKALHKPNFAMIKGRDKNGKPTVKRVEYFDLWWAWSLRRTFADGVTFAPPKDVRAPPQRSSYVFNTFKGIVKPEPGSVKTWDRLRAHYFDNYCHGDAEYFDWLMTWFAQHHQQPGLKLGSAVVVKGKKGTGKSLGLDYFRAGLGRYAVKVSNRRYITGNFNAHQQGIIHITAEEAFWAGDKQAGGALKDLITSPKMTLELKGIDPIEVPNFIRCAFVSNERWVVPADLEGEERRFFVLEISDDRRQDIEYFAEIAEEMENGGLAAMVAELSEYQPKQGWSVLRTPPETPWLVEQGRQSAEDDVRFFIRLIELGALGGVEHPFIPELKLEGELGLEEPEGKAADGEAFLPIPYGVALLQFEHWMTRMGDRRNIKDQFKQMATRMLLAGPELKTWRVALQTPERDRDTGGHLIDNASVKCLICPPLRVIRRAAVDAGYIAADKFAADELATPAEVAKARVKLQATAKRGL